MKQEVVATGVHPVKSFQVSQSVLLIEFPGLKRSISAVEAASNCDDALLWNCSILWGVVLWFLGPVVLQLFAPPLTYANSKIPKLSTLVVDSTLLQDSRCLLLLHLYE